MCGSALRQTGSCCLLNLIGLPDGRWRHEPGVVVSTTARSRVGGELIASLEEALSFLIYPATRREMRVNLHFSPGGVIMAQDFLLQRVLATEERSRNYVRGSMCALKGKRQARARPAPYRTE